MREYSVRGITLSPEEEFNYVPTCCLLSAGYTTGWTTPLGGETNIFIAILPLHTEETKQVEMSVITELPRSKEKETLHSGNIVLEPSILLV